MSHDEPITTLNWGVSPNNRWSFQYMQALFPIRKEGKWDYLRAF